MTVIENLSKYAHLFRQIAFEKLFPRDFRYTLLHDDIREFR